MKRKLIAGIAASLLFTACGINVADKVVVTFETAQKYLTEGNYQEAVEAFTALIEIDPNNEDLYMGRADAYTYLEQYPEAVDDYSTVVSINDENQDAYVYRGVLNYVTDEPEEGEEDLQHVSDMTAESEEDNESVFDKLIQYLERLEIEIEDEQDNGTTTQIVYKFPLGFRIVIKRTTDEPFGVDTISEDDPIPELIDYTEEADTFLNSFVSQAYHDQDIVYNHSTNEPVEGPLSLARMYDALHEEDSQRYPLETIYDFNNENYSLSADDRARAQNDPDVRSWINSFWRFNLKAVEDVLDRLYGKDQVTPEEFFSGQCFETSDGYLLLPSVGTDYLQTGAFRYKIRSVEVDGNQIAVTVNCLLVDCEYRYDEEIMWQVPDFGTYYVADMVSEEIIDRGSDSSLTDYDDYGTFADNYTIQGNSAGETVIYLFHDDDGMHLR